MRGSERLKKPLLRGKWRGKRKTPPRRTDVPSTLNTQSCESQTPSRFRWPEIMKPAMRASASDVLRLCESRAQTTPLCALPVNQVLSHVRCTRCDQLSVSVRQVEGNTHTHTHARVHTHSFVKTKPRNVQSSNERRKMETLKMPIPVFEISGA